MSEERAFAYRAVRPDGTAVRDVVRATDRSSAARRLSQGDLIVIDLQPVDAAAGLAPSKPQERIIVLRQLAVMIGAGVELLEALDTAIDGFGDRPIVRHLRAAANALRRGDPLSRALKEHVPGYPHYVYALVRAGEASGRLPQVLKEAADQVAFEDQVRRDVGAALTYPAFLLCAGLAAMAFLLSVVVPRFAAMIGDLSRIDPFPAFILGAGLAVQSNGILIVAVVAAALIAIRQIIATPSARRAIVHAARRLPVVGALLTTRGLMAWARIMSLSLSAGLNVQESAQLARASVADDRRLQSALAEAEAALRAGQPIEAAFARPGGLGALDASLVRAGARAGSLADMFGLIASQHEARLRADLKRATVIVEQVAIAIVASAIGAIVIGLVTALTGVYDSIG